MFFFKNCLKIASLRIGKHRIVQNIASLRKVNIAHPYLQLQPKTSQNRGGVAGDSRRHRLEDCENGEGQEVLIKLDENGNDGNGVDNDGHGAGDNDWCSPSSSHT